MSYTVNYDALGLTEEQKKKKAIDDCKFYLGTKLFNKVIKAMKEDSKKGCKKENIEWTLSFVGIQGYPAKVLVDTYLKTDE